MTIWRRLIPAFFVAMVGMTERSASAQSLTLAWDPSPDPAVIGYVVYVGTSPGEYTSTYDVGNVSSFVFQASPGQAYFFAVASYATGHLIGPPSSPVSTMPETTVPVTPLPATDVMLWNPGDQMTAIGEATALQLYGEDPLEQGLTFSGQGLPSGLWLDRAGGIINGTPSDAGTYWVTVSASNGYSTASQSFTWTTWLSSSDVRPPVATVTYSEVVEWEPSRYVALGGTSTDEVGVSAVWWINDRDDGGVASGTDFWYTVIWLYPGANEITILAFDEAGNVGTTTYSIYW